MQPSSSKTWNCKYKYPSWTTDQTDSLQRKYSHTEKESWLEGLYSGFANIWVSAQVAKDNEDGYDLDQCGNTWQGRQVFQLPDEGARDVDQQWHQNYDVCAHCHPTRGEHLKGRAEITGSDNQKSTSVNLWCHAPIVCKNNCSIGSLTHFTTCNACVCQNVDKFPPLTGLFANRYQCWKAVWRLWTMAPDTLPESSDTRWSMTCPGPAYALPAAYFQPQTRHRRSKDPFVWWWETRSQ